MGRSVWMQMACRRSRNCVFMSKKHVVRIANETQLLMPAVSTLQNLRFTVTDSRRLSLHSVFPGSQTLLLFERSFGHIHTTGDINIFSTYFQVNYSRPTANALEVGASCFNHYCIGYEYTQLNVLHNVHRRIS